MSLANKNWVGLDGTPVTGAVPPQLLVMQGKLTPERHGAVAHAYHLFCLAKATAVGEFFISNRVLTDGTRVRCESMQKIDRVLVWADGGEDVVAKLPHGFGVITNWQAPRFYWKPNKTAWQAPGNTPPQLQSGDVTYNHVTYEMQNGDRKWWEFFPMVYSAKSKQLWGWAPYKGLDMTSDGAVLPEPGFGRGKNAIVPIALNYPNGKGGVVRRSRHFAVDDWILAQDGQKLYAMAEVEPMTLNDNDPLRKLPPCSDSTGTRVALQQWRRWLVSPTNEIYRFRLCNEVLERTGATAYTLIARHVEEFSTTLRLPDAPPQFGELEERPEEPQFVGIGAYAGTSWKIGTYVTDSNGNKKFIPDPYWTDKVQWVIYGCWFAPVGEEYTGGILRLSSGGWRRYSGSSKNSEEYPHYMAIPGWSGVNYCRLINGLAYPPNIFMQAASRANKANANIGDLPRSYGLYSHALRRRNAEHSINANPKLTLDFGWTQIHMIEGEVIGQYIAHANEDLRTNKNSYASYEYEQEVMKTWWTHADLRGVTPDGEDSIGYNAINATMSNLVDFAHIEEEFPGNGTEVENLDKLEPKCTGSYTYKTRYILDFDNRAQFCAAIRVEVSCANASWSQLPEWYLGALKSDGPASYTAKIFFEVRIGGTTYSKLLTADSASRYMFEFRAIQYDNVLIWPQPDLGKPLWVYMPPELVPPMEAHMHLEAIAAHQGINTKFAGHDIPGPYAVIPPKQVSEKQLEYSRYDGKKEIPHPKRPTGALYARTFSLSDYLDNALWIFGQRFLRFDAPRNNSYLNPDSPPWYYFPILGRAITSGEKIHIEFRDNQFVDWTDDIPSANQNNPKPPKKERTIEVYYV